MRGVSIRILDEQEQPVEQGKEGQVAVDAPSMMSGYLSEAGPMVDGHFLTGDLGHLDAHGALVVSGRMKLLIDVGGLKVNPLEVEKVLMEHPGVGECVVVAMAITPTVSRLRAVLVARHGAQPVASRDLREYAKARLSAYKVPRTFEWRDALPRSSTGKILRHLIQSDTP
jgi:long-chain acyl-CoA synthetase